MQGRLPVVDLPGEAQPEVGAGGGLDRAERAVRERRHHRAGPVGREGGATPLGTLLRNALPDNGCGRCADNK